MPSLSTKYNNLVPWSETDLQWEKKLGSGVSHVPSGSLSFFSYQWGCNPTPCDGTMGNCESRLAQGKETVVAQQKQLLLFGSTLLLGGPCMCHGEHVAIRAQLTESAFSLYHVVWVIEVRLSVLVASTPHLLKHLSGPLRIQQIAQI